MPLVKTFIEACQYHGINPDTAVPDLSNLPEEIALMTAANIKFDLVNDAIRDSKKFDWNDSSQRKHYAWFWLSNAEDEGGPSGFRSSARLALARARMSALGFAFSPMHS